MRPQEWGSAPGPINPTAATPCQPRAPRRAVRGNSVCFGIFTCLFTSRYKEIFNAGILRNYHNSVNMLSMFHCRKRIPYITWVIFIFLSGTLKHGGKINNSPHPYPNSITLQMGKCRENVSTTAGIKPERIYLLY